MPVSKKRKKKAPPKIRNKTHNEVPELLFDKMVLRYLPDIDEFYFEELVIVDPKRNMKVPCRGYMDSVYLADLKDGSSVGVRILAPKAWQKIEAFTEKYVYEMYLPRESNKNFYTYVLGWFCTTGDMIDDDQFDPEKHGRLVFDSNGSYFKDEDLPNFVKWENDYE